MWHRLCGFALLSLTVVVAPASAQADLAWKFKKGDVFFVESTTTTTAQSTAGAAKPVNSENVVTTISRFEVLDASADAAVLKQRIEGARVKSNGAADPTAERAANLLKGVEFSVTLTPRGKVTGLTGYEDFLRKLTGGNLVLEQKARTSFPKEAFQEELTALFGFLPPGAASEGSSWKRSEVLTRGEVGTLAGETTYTYRGGGRIDLTRALTHEAPKEGNPRLGNVRVQEAGGTIRFDPQAGRLVSQDLAMQLTGTVTLTDANQKTTAVTVRETTKRSVRLVDKNPLEAAKP